MQPYDCMQRWRLNSESEDERSCFGRWVLSRLTPELRWSRRRNELRRRADDCALGVRRGHSTSHVLWNKRGHAGRDVRAAVPRGDTRSARRVRMLARTSRGIRMAPGGAQQRGAWLRRECQHDRKDSCSEHVDARQFQGQDPRHPFCRELQRKTFVFESVSRLSSLRLRNFAARRQKFPSPTNSSL